MKKILAVVLALMMVLPFSVFGAFADTVTPDTSWYDANATEYVLKDAADLLGFSQISATTTFAGKTVKLGADIVLNEGDAATWSTQAPAISWTPAGKFAGTFDGHGHSISGVYCVGGSSVSFFYQLDGATVKNLSLVNSYFAATTGNNVAAFSQYSYGVITFDTVYTDAIVSGAAYNAGGFIATMGSATEGHFKNVWFDGSVTLAIRYGAGIVANGEGKKVYVENSLNTGSVYTSYNGGQNSHIAGIVGRNDGATYITNCLNLGKISTANTEAGINDTIGSIFGACSGNNQTEDKSAWISHVSIKDSWATTESCVSVLGNNSSKDPSQVAVYGAVSEKIMKGYGAYVNTTLDFEKVWAVNLEGMPTLRAYTDESKIPPLYKVNSPAMSEPELKLDGRFGPRWTLSLEIPEGMKAENVKIGALIVPTKAIPADHDVNLDDTYYEYRGNKYEVANVEGKILRESKEGTLVATFVVKDLTAANARMNFTAVPYAVYTVDSGATIAMYGAGTSMSFYQETVLSLDGASEENKAKAEAVLAPIDKEMGGRFPVAEFWGKEDVFEEVPALIIPDAEVTPSTNYGDNNYVISVKGTQDADYYAYLELLESFGFEKVYDNGEKGIEDVVYTASYAKGDLLVTVTDMCYTNTTTVSAVWDLPLSENLYSNVYGEGDGEITMHVNEMYNWGNSILFKLPNGHFIMNDGATDDELPYLLDYLETLVPEGEIPVIDAWFFSHMHYDHCCVVRPFIKNAEWRDRIRVNGFYYNEPSNAVKDMDPGVYGQIDEVEVAIGLLKTEKGETPKMYRPQSGQIYYFSGMTVEVLLGQEQIPVSTYEGGFNDSSTWLRFNIGDQDVLIAGDTHRAGMKTVIRSYDPEMLDFDIFFSFHHGSNTWQDFTDYANYTTVIHPSTGLPGGANVALGEKAVANGGEVLVEGGGSLVLTFPYKVGTSVKLEGKKWEYHGGTRK